MNLTVVADGRHPVPTELTLEGDGGADAQVGRPAGDRLRPTEGATQTVADPVRPAHRARALRLVVDAVRERHHERSGQRGRHVPVSIAEVGLTGVPVPPAPAHRRHRVPRAISFA